MSVDGIFSLKTSPRGGAGGFAHSLEFSKAARTAMIAVVGRGVVAVSGIILWKAVFGRSEGFERAGSQCLESGLWWRFCTGIASRNSLAPGVGCG